MFTRAKQAEVIRSSQKDEYYSSVLKSKLAEILQSIAGPRYWLRWNKEYDMLADIVYFTLTTFGGYQTLGEEYVNILLVSGSLKKLPDRLQRMVMILTQCCMPYIFDKCLLALEKRVDQNRIEGLTLEGKVMLKQLIQAARHAIMIFHRCHLALFYIRGFFYHISKRVTDIHYILVRPDPNQQRASNYKILGWLCAVQLMWTFLQQFAVLWRKWRQNSGSRFSTLEKTGRTPEDAAVVSRDPEMDTAGTRATCPLCLEKRQSSTCTPCGHVFCWTCIHEWARANTVCPICRQDCESSRLVCLKNYDYV